MVNSNFDVNQADSYEDYYFLRKVIKFKKTKIENVKFRHFKK